MGQTITITLRYFAFLRERRRKEQEWLTLEAGSNLRALKEKLSSLDPVLGADLASVRFAVNQEMATDEFELKDGDEVAFIPPVAGG